MGTRGILAFAHGDKLKATYNHFDSYPTGLGAEVLEWLVGADFAAAIELFDRLEPVKEDSVPTDDQQLALLRYFDPAVSSKSSQDWYSLLRGTQGNPQLILDAGFFVDYESFALDSLFCEWGYVIDLDNRQVEVYKGFQTAKPAAGRWKDSDYVSKEDYRPGRDYYPIALVRTVPLTEILSTNWKYPGEAIKYIVEAIEEEGSEEDE